MQVIKGFKCVACDKWKGTRHIASTVEIEEYEYHLCDACSEERSRKFDSDTALILYEIDLDGGAQEFMSNEGWGYCSLYERYLLLICQGFVHVESYESAEGARKAFDRYYDEGWGYSEDDYVIVQDRGYTEVFEGHKSVFRIENEDYPDPLRRARAFISLRMRKDGYYPNVWLQHYNGEVRRIDVW